jgi:hypothetical protein
MDWDFPKTQKVAAIMNEVANVGMNGLPGYKAVFVKI